jgi:integrase/recombinase XerD
MSPERSLQVIDRGTMPLVSAGSPYPLEKHPVAAYLLQMSPAGRQGMRDNLVRAAKILTQGRCADPYSLAWHTISYVRVLALRRRLAEKYDLQTTNVTLAAVKGVLKQAWLLGYLTREEFERVCQIKAVRGSRLSPGRWVETEELASLFRSCREDPRQPLGQRDAAMLALLVGLGLRRAEAADVQLKDVDLQAGTLTVVRGKGNKSRRLALVGGTAQAVKDWINVRGTWEGPLLVRCWRHNHMTREALSYRVIGMLVKARIRCAGLTKASPHDFRRSFISGLLDQGADVTTVARLAGHANVVTTARYDRRGERSEKAALRLLHVPY